MPTARRAAASLRTVSANSAQDICSSCACMRAFVRARAHVSLQPPPRRSDCLPPLSALHSPPRLPLSALHSPPRTQRGMYPGPRIARAKTGRGVSYPANRSRVVRIAHLRAPQAAADRGHGRGWRSRLSLSGVDCVRSGWTSRHTPPRSSQFARLGDTNPSCPQRHPSEAMPVKSGAVLAVLVAATVCVSPVLSA